jgi:murein DD-endopeptidase MepM/ murein hydrolase activator NlpD
MSRLLLFLLGIALGASGVYLLFRNGTFQVPAPAVVVAKAESPVVPGTNPPLPAPDGIELPGAPAMPASVDVASEPLPPATLPLPASEPAPGAEDANASEVPLPTSTEAVAAVTAASTSGSMLIPVQGVQAAKLVDTFTQSRGTGRLHDAIDIMAARGTPVLAVADGRVAKLFDSKPGGLTVYQFDREEKLAYYYAHLDRYAEGLAEGRVLKRGEVLGYVGSTGNASPDAPHLHFAVFVLGPEKHWWQGTAVNPYPLLGGR